jgi:hypothetical protein
MVDLDTTGKAVDVELKDPKADTKKRLKQKMSLL